ncbi:nucleotide disphospho-sugar-binding domain-containing protein [Gordonia sp. CPCC 205515]|uniref:glycosyltransferase n=1 Tax=Gordonia sp. CPCC 205515 TaxID=3140791 RepID=UPI003AF358E7
MSTFLFASIPVQAHSTNPLPFAARLIERGHTVLWYAGSAFAGQIAAIGATHVPYQHAADFSGHDLFEYYPWLAGRSGPKVIGEVFDRIFVGHAPQRISDLQPVLADHRVNAMLTDGLMYGVGMLGELTGIPVATFGDGPLPQSDPDVPPFGPGLLPMGGPLGGLRNRAVSAFARRVLFADAERRYQQIRTDLGLPRDPSGALDGLMSRDLHLQGCTPSFEYPRRNPLPASVHWVGALQPDPAPAWSPPLWWPDVLQSERPVVHVTQGSLRADMTELIGPAIRGLADRNVLVVVTTGGPDRAEVERVIGGPLPDNVRVTPFVPYDLLLGRAQVMVTNGGYTGVTLALRHGVPLVQAGTTEEKSEIGARIEWSGVGRRLRTTRPSPRAVADAVADVLSNPSYRSAAQRIQEEMACHDAGREGADLLERLAVDRLAPRP